MREEESSASRSVRIRRIFEACLDLSPDERVAFLEKACEDNAVIRQEVEILLRQAEKEANPLDDLTQSMLRPTLDAIRKDPTRLDELLNQIYAEEETSADPWIGRTVTHFRILESIGRGGMGVVYKALDLNLSRTVALKFLPANLCADASAIKRIMHEARTTSALEHPNIATVYEVGETDDQQVFIAMAYYSGESLTRTIENGALDPEVALSYAAQLAGALAKAHALGIIHRDLKPGNVMTDADGTVKLLDFGLAKLSDVSVLTQAGMLAGTVAYMSPEQVRGDKVDHRTDFWSLGVVLYEMLTGQRPYTGESAGSIMNSILTREPLPIEKLDAAIPRDIRRIIRKCLAKKPADRYRQAGELVQDLRQVKTVMTDQLQKGYPVTIMDSWPIRIATGIALAALLVMSALLFRSSTDFGNAAALPAAVPESPEEVTANPIIHSLAVLPFTNLSANPDLDSFAAGLHETTIIELAKIDSLKVATRPETLSYGATPGPLDVIAEELGVQALAFGTIQEAGNWIRVSAQLVDLRADRHLWAESFDREFATAAIFNTQNEIASAIQRAISRFLPADSTDNGPQLPSKNTLALEAYEKGRDAHDIGTRASRTEAAGHYLEAIGRDPGFALAKAAMAQLTLEQMLFFDLSSESLNHASLTVREYAKNAIRLDSKLGAAYVPLGMYRWLNGDPSTALQVLTCAIDFDPQNADAQMAMGWLHRDHFASYWSARDFLENAAEIRSLSRIQKVLLAHLGHSAEEQQAILEAELERDPTSSLAMIGLASLHHFVFNEYDIALSWYIKALRQNPDIPVACLRIAMIYDRLGRFSLASEWINRLGVRSRSGMDIPLLALHREEAEGVYFIQSNARSVHAYSRSITLELEDLYSAGEYETALELCRYKVSPLLDFHPSDSLPGHYRIVRDPFGNSEGKVLKIGLEDPVNIYRKAIAARSLPNEAIHSGKEGDDTAFTFYLKFGQPESEGKHLHTNMTWGLLETEQFPSVLEHAGSARFLYVNYSTIMRSFEDGFLDIRDGDRYTSVVDDFLDTETYYHVWFVVKPARNAYDVYIKGGSQFPRQQLVIRNATFRRRPHQPLNTFMIINDLIRGQDPIYMDDLHVYPHGEALSVPDADWILVDDFEDGELDGWQFEGWSDALLSNTDLVFQVVRILLATGHESSADGLINLLAERYWESTPWEWLGISRIRALKHDRVGVLEALNMLNASGYAERQIGQYPEFGFMLDDPEFQWLTGQMEARLNAQLARIEEMQAAGEIPGPFD